MDKVPFVIGGDIMRKRYYAYAALAIVTGLAAVIPSNVSVAKETVIEEQNMHLIQEGDFIVPDKDYSFEEDTLISYLDGNESSNNSETIPLEQRKKSCATKLYNAMINLDSEIEVSEYELTKEEFKKVISDVVNSNPELFYIGQKYGTTKVEGTDIVKKCLGFYENQKKIKDDNGNITGYTTVDKADILAKKKEIEDKRDEVLATAITEKMPIEEKALLIHDYLDLNVEYDYQAYLQEQEDGKTHYTESDYDIYGALIEKKAVCQGYSLAFKYLMEAAGCENIGFATTNSHVWNTVTINGEGYNVDCTWDDPNWDTLGNVRHNYLLRGKNFANHGTVLDTDRECNGTKFDNYFWCGINSGIFYHEGKLYFINAEGKLCKRNGIDVDDKEETTDLSLETTDSWNYVNAAKLALAKNYVVYHDQKSLYACKYKNGEKGELYKPSLDEEEEIYGLAVKGDTLSYATRNRQEILDNNITEQFVYTYALPDDPFRVPVESVTITGTNTLHITMQNGVYSYEKGQLKATVTPSDATNKKIYAWTSSDESVLRVDVNGVIVAVSPGTVTVKAVSYDGPTAAYKVSVVMEGDITSSDGSVVHYDEGKLLSNQFYTENGNTYYLGADGKRVKGYTTISGNQYYFNKDGVMLTGWQNIDGNIYCFKSNGVMLTGWQKINGNSYYFNEKGVMLTGWQEINGFKYYFNDKGISLTVGWQMIDGKQYYFNMQGVPVTGWQIIEGNTYYFDGKGIMLTGWQKLSGKKYYFNKEGVMLNGWRKISKKKYYFNKKGVMQTGWKTINKKRYYFNKKGVMQTGWKTINKKKYYFTKKGVMVKGLTTIKGVSYYFANDGHFIS